jgi:NADPH-dependent 2,4-dienoyl-CoA reductase/sulfur reductase-like enzyme
MNTPTGAVAVVGGGLAGLGAVRALRAQGYSGRVVAIGTEPWPPYDRPPLSKEFLAGALSREALSLAAPQDDGLEVETLTGGPAVALDAGRRTVRLGSGEWVGGDGVVIATGARARSLPGPALEGVHTLRTLSDSMQLREQLRPGARLVVVGAGFIGAEVASTARGLGVEVTVVEAAAVPLAAALGEQLGAVCGQLHADHGVTLVTSVGVESLLGDEGVSPEDAGQVHGVRLSDGREVRADVVLVAVGSRPNVEWLAGSGLDVAGGVLTDADGSTAAPGVVATGDCTRRFDPAVGGHVRQEHWTNALHHPQLAVAALLGTAPAALPATVALPYFWSDQYGVKVQFAGHRQAGDEPRVLEGDVEDRTFTAVYHRGDQPVAVLSMNQPRVFGAWRRRLIAALTAGTGPVT